MRGLQIHVIDTEGRNLLQIIYFLCLSLNSSLRLRNFATSRSKNTTLMFLFTIYTYLCLYLYNA